MVVASVVTRSCILALPTLLLHLNLRRSCSTSKQVQYLLDQFDIFSKAWRMDRVQQNVLLDSRSQSLLSNEFDPN